MVAGLVCTAVGAKKAGHGLQPHPVPEHSDRSCLLQACAWQKCSRMDQEDVIHIGSLFCVAFICWIWVSSEQAHSTGKGYMLQSSPNMALCSATHQVGSTYRRGARVGQPLQKSPHQLFHLCAQSEGVVQRRAALEEDLPWVNESCVCSGFS